jgi:glucokinase
VERHALVVDLGGTKIAAARVGDSGTITHRASVATPPEGGQAVVDAIAEVIRRLPMKNSCAIGVDVAGLAYPDGAVWAPNISGWERMPLGKSLRREFGLPVTIESDRNACVIGEAWRGAAHGCSDVVFVAIGTGIGAGIISGGRLLRGVGELAGCLGWMSVEPRFLEKYKRCGCLEYHAAGQGMARVITRALRTKTSTREMVKLAKEGNHAANHVLRHAGEYLGIALANVVSLLNPQKIVIGGGVAAAGELLLAPAREAMRQWAQPLAVEQVQIVRSRLGSNAPLLGMAKVTLESCAGTS